MISLEDRPTISVFRGPNGHLEETDILDICETDGDQFLLLYQVRCHDPIFQHLGKPTFEKFRGRGKKTRYARFFTAEQIAVAERETADFLKEIDNV